MDHLILEKNVSPKSPWSLDTRVLSMEKLIWC